MFISNIYWFSHHVFWYRRLFLVFFSVDNVLSFSHCLCLSISALLTLKNYMFFHADTVCLHLLLWSLNIDIPTIPFSFSFFNFISIHCHTSQIINSPSRQIYITQRHLDNNESLIPTHSYDLFNLEPNLQDKEGNVFYCRLMSWDLKSLTCDQDEACHGWQLRQTLEWTWIAGRSRNKVSLMSLPFVPQDSINNNNTRLAGWARALCRGGL